VIKISYVPQYTSELLIEGITQITITTATKPTTAQTLAWIEEIEKGMDSKLLGSYTATDEYIDVPSQRSVSRFTLEWLELLSTYG